MGAGRVAVLRGRGQRRVAVGVVDVKMAVHQIPQRLAGHGGDACYQRPSRVRRPLRIHRQHIVVIDEYPGRRVDADRARIVGAIDRLGDLRHPMAKALTLGRDVP